MTHPEPPSPSSPPPDRPSALVLAQIADALPWPLLLLRRDALLLHANLAARQLLHRGQTLRIDAGQRVQPAAPGRQPAFSAALAAAEPTLLHWPAEADAARPAPAHAAGCSVTLKPLAANDGDPQGPGHGTVLVMLSTSASRHADLQAFAQMHQLTPLETRVLEQLSLGCSNAAAAAALGVKPATVRSAVTGLRRKSGHASVAALLLALAAMPPLATTLHLVQPARPGPGE